MVLWDYGTSVYRQTHLLFALVCHATNEPKANDAKGGKMNVQSTLYALTRLSITLTFLLAAIGPAQAAPAPNLEPAQTLARSGEAAPPSLPDVPGATQDW